VIALIVILAGIAIAVVVIVFYKRDKFRREPFDFQKMSDLQERELESYVKTELSTPLPKANEASNEPEKVDLSAEN